jgi:cytochrome c biogenesis factor
MTEIGRLAICLALMCALFSVGAAVTGAIRRRRDIVRSAERAAYAVFALVVVAAGILLHALLTHDFSLEYVAAYSSSTLPTNYVVAALWAARRVAPLLGPRPHVLLDARPLAEPRAEPRAHAVGHGDAHDHRVVLPGLVVFITDPFERLPVPALEGADLNRSSRTTG